MGKNPAFLPDPKKKTLMATCLSCAEGHQYPGENWQWLAKEIVTARKFEIFKNGGDVAKSVCPSCKRRDTLPQKAA